MRGMITGLELDASLDDLASTFSVTLEAIALQTRHIVETMNGKGHCIDSIYMSGSQAKNAPLMRLLATVLDMPIVLPPHPSAAVVFGSAILGRFAHETSQAHTIESQADADRAAQDGAKLWDIMVAMTPAAKRVEPMQGEKGAAEKKLLQAKYEIFLESIDIQRRWRQRVAEAVA